MAYNVFYSALKIGYINKTHTHTESGAENSLCQFYWLIQNCFLRSIGRKWKTYWSLLASSRAVIQLIMRVNKPTFAYNLVQLYRKNLKGEPWLIIIKPKKQYTLAIKPDTFLKGTGSRFSTCSFIKILFFAGTCCIVYARNITMS